MDTEFGIASSLEALRGKLRAMGISARELSRRAEVSVPVCVEALGNGDWVPSVRVALRLERVAERALRKQRAA